MKATTKQAYSVLDTAADVESDRIAISDSSIIAKEAYHQNKPKYAACAYLSLFVGFSVAFLLACGGCARTATYAVIDVECFHALGGGASVNGGGFDSSITKTPACKKALKEYLKPGGKYWQEVHIAADRAMQYYKSVPVVGSNQVVIFDIDETTLSNMDEFIANDLSSHPSNIKQTLQSNSPAIGPILAVYNYLYASNYTVSFITGRNENSREHTVNNLETAGYGKQCASQSNGLPIRTVQPCYLQLDLRELNDTRFASVYKPDRRRMLTEKGWEMAGSFGDQFSDLEGEYSAKASFKLPNPMYYIL